MVLFNITIHELFITFLLMLVLVLLLIVAVLYYSFNQYKELLSVSKWSTIIDKRVFEAIVYNKGEKSADDDFTQNSQKASFRNLFLEILVGSEKKFSGVAQDEITDLFHVHNLQKEAFAKLNQKKAHLIAGGIQELTAMKIESALPKISAFLSHPNPHVYQEAQYALVAFRGFEGLRFLDDTIHKISDWHQLRLLLSIPNVPENCEQEITAWLESTNDSVIIFTLSLLKKFQMLAFYPLVWKLLQHESTEVRIFAVHTVMALENFQTIPDLAKIFPDQHIEVQLTILNLMELSKDQNSVQFLKNQLLHHPNTGIKIAAAEALFALGHKNFLNKTQQDSETEELIQIIKHALQEKIC